MSQKNLDSVRKKDVQENEMRARLEVRLSVKEKEVLRMTSKAAGMTASQAVRLLIQGYLVGKIKITAE